jgi:hypothetical protein
MSTPAGWYDDGSGRQRWWDGANWSDHYQDQAPATSPAAGPTADASATAQAAPAQTYPQPGAATATALPPASAEAARARKPHVLGIIALAVAVVGFIFACVPGALIVGWILLPIAFVLSIVALFLSGAKWPAITGLILAVVGTVVGFVVFFAVVAQAANDAFGDKGSSVVSGGDSAPVESAGGDSGTATSDYAVTIDKATVTKDYEGKPAIVVDFTFTNNSDKDANFMFAVSSKAFQNGVELETAVITDDGFKLADALKDIKPGTTIPVQLAYTLSDTSDVSIEATELISLDDTMLAKKTFSVK